MALTQQKFSQADERRRSLIFEAQQGDLDALTTCVSENLGLVHILVRRSRPDRHPHVTYDDLLSAGVEGMIIAIKKFDLDQNLRFSTYAAFWISAYIDRCKMTMSRVSVSPARKSQQELIAQIEAELVASLGRVPTDSEIAKYTQRKFGESAVKDNRYPIQLSSLEETMVDRPTYDHHDITAIDVRTAINGTEGLTDSHRRILRMVFGIDCEAMSLGEIAEELQVGKNIVSQQRDEALTILRESPLLEGYEL